MDESPSKKRRRAKFKELTENLSKEELIRRLKSAAHELSTIDQGENSNDIEGFAASLATYLIFYHQDKDVKYFAGCCFCDILRIFAPEPPYNEEQLKDVFRLLLSQLKNLESVQSPVHRRYFYILDSLALVKSFNVCAELEAHDIILELFKIFFHIISNQHNLREKTYMLDIMSPLIQDGGSLPQEVLDVILENMVEPRRSKRPEAFQLACKLMERCATAITPDILLFFNRTFVLGTPPAPELNGKLYDLLYQLYCVSRSVLRSVLPQLDFKIKGSDEKDRLDTVRLLGRMFDYDHANSSEIEKVLWNCYLGRFVDVQSDIRMECIRISKQFLISSSQPHRNDVTEHLLQRFLDADEKVRLETVVVVCDAALQNPLLVQSELLDAVKGRTRDKKWLIRREAMTCIGKLYKHVYRSKNVNLCKDLSWVPSCILQLYVHNSIEDRLCIEKIFHDSLVPISLDATGKMQQLLHVYTSLDDITANIFDGIMSHRSKVKSDFRELLRLYQDNEDKEKEKKIFRYTVAVARCLPNPLRAKDHLTILLNMCKEKKFVKLLDTCTDITKECSTIESAVTAIVNEIKCKKNTIMDTVKALLNRACPMLVDMPSLTILLKEIKMLVDGIDDHNNVSEDENEEDLLKKGKSGFRLLKCLARNDPPIFQSQQCYEAFLLFLKSQDPEIEISQPSLYFHALLFSTSVEYTLEALTFVIGGLEEVDKALCSCYQPVLSKLITHGTSKQSKFAMRCLNTMLKDCTIVLERIFKNLLDSLHFSGPVGRLRTTLSALCEIAVLAPNIFDGKQKFIIRDFVVKDLLLIDRRDTSSDSQESDDEEEWKSDIHVSQETWEKVQGLKLLTHWLSGLEARHCESAIPVFRLMYTLLNHDGDLTGSGKISAVNRSRLRLAAGTCLLKLAQNVNYVDVITLEQYQRLALVMQDSCFEVREKFTGKLHKALEHLKLPLDYMAFFALVAADPSKERKLKVRQMILRNAQVRRDLSKQHSAAAARPYNVLPEYSLPYVVHLLSHHPDFNHTNTRSLRSTKDCLWFFLEPLMGIKAENYSFLKRMLEKIKQTKDRQEPEVVEVNKKLYAVCDLAVQCIMNKCQTFTLKDFPGNVLLPKRLFAAQKEMNNMKSYLPKNFILSPKSGKQKSGENSKKEKPIEYGENVLTSSSLESTKRTTLTSTENQTQAKKSRLSASTEKKTSKYPLRSHRSVVRNLAFELTTPAIGSYHDAAQPLKTKKKKQLTMDSFVSSVNQSEDSTSDAEADVSVQTPDEIPALEANSNIRVSKSKIFTDIINKDEEVMDEAPPINRHCPSEHNKTQQDEVTKPAKLNVRRKQRSRR